MIVLVPKIWYAWDAILAYASYRTYVRLVLPAMPSTYHTMFQKEKKNPINLVFVVVLKTFYDNFWLDFTVIWRFNDQNLLNSNMFCKILFWSEQLLRSKDFVAKTCSMYICTKIILLQILWDELSLSLNFRL